MATEMAAGKWIEFENRTIDTVVRTIIGTDKPLHTLWRHAEWLEKCSSPPHRTPMT